MPAGLVDTRQLRLELLEFAPSADRQTLRLRARWTLSDPRGDMPPQASEADIRLPTDGPRPEQWMDAYRLAMWRLAERIAQPTPAR
jgi:hypothetical protein